MHAQRSMSNAQYFDGVYAMGEHVDWLLDVDVFSTDRSLMASTYWDYNSQAVVGCLYIKVDTN